ncbi:DNA-binding Xre family transcriptional regulator [Virgibacillus natechei]|uniref:DNA-binding Xre family transcriptional regulator n=1 Tax=Virgibacillus natechei TaxID=1216297 RepID=A0ABS4IAT5_9BACI|nr:helix-turn-helix transcriptional regulator [Virgibacillus natechei]MBP1968008.1 DNA-binding Xre family transcriptional regulator [Virgibacillus natechei]UZD14709.1 helix-turn-helix transcriptional regulator [Virgibacillus natechei]
MIKLNLRYQMETKGLSTSKLVELTGVHRNTISKLLNGNSNGIQFETLDLLCKALDVDSSCDIVEFVSDDD